MELSPGYATAHQWLGNVLIATGRFDEAARAMRRAIEVDPLSLIASTALGYAYHFARQYDDALAQLRRTLDLDPSFHLARVGEGLTLVLAGRADEGIAALAHARAFAPADPALAANLALALARAGRRDDAHRILADLRPPEGATHLPSYEIARAHLALRDPERALGWLERARDERSHSMVFLTVDPFLDPLRDHPAATACSLKCGLAEVWR